MKAAGAEAQVHVQYNSRWAGAQLVNGKLTYKGKRYPIVGASAEYDSGAVVGQRPTFTRIVAGGIVAGPVGAVVGGMFKKDRNRVYVAVSLPAVGVIVLDGPAKEDNQAREFARRINAAGQHYT